MSENETFEVDGCAIIGRTFDEYVQMFDLDPAALPSPLLDCPSGVGGFVATANERGISTVGADVIYGRSRERLERRCKEDLEHVAYQISEKKELFEWDVHGSVEHRFGN